MNIGDLVNFHTSTWIFKHAESNYTNPGIIIEEDLEHRQASYVILWSDGRVTKETNCYLIPAEIK